MTTDTIEDEGDRRLARWAEWTRGNEGANGYPRMQPFTRLVTPTGDSPVGPMPEEVARTDKAVSVIRHRYKSVLWRAIRQYYLSRDAVTVSMRECSTSRAGYYRLVKRAQRKVMELINA